MRMPHYIVVVGLLLLVGSARAEEELTLEQIKAAAASRSKYLSTQLLPAASESPKAKLKAFREEIEPILKKTCYECHGSVTAEDEFRVDKLDPDLLHGEDVEWWLEVSEAVTNGEMPPDDGPELTDDDRNKIIEWLSSEIQTASQVRRSEQGHTSFRRMTRYEYNYVLQELLGLPVDFAKDLKPDPVSDDGFKNSSETLRMTSSQYADYLELNRNALNRAAVRGERPEVLYWGVSAERASADRFSRRERGNDSSEDRTRRGEQEERDRQRNDRDDRDERGAYYKNTATGQTVPATWSFRRAAHAWTPTQTLPEVPEPSDYIAVLPAGERLVVELGNRLPDEGTLRVRVRAWRAITEGDNLPTVALEFGWQGNNNSKASFQISDHDLVIDAAPGKPTFYQWEIPLSEIYPRNPVRKTVELGTPKRTNPSEYIRLHNTSQSAELQLNYVEVAAPVYKEWPPASHTAIFIDSDNSDDETAYAREIISRFMRRAWRRDVSDAEVARKMEHFVRIRPVCDDFQHAVIEVLATVLSSPRFLYLVQTDRSSEEAGVKLDDFELVPQITSPFPLEINLTQTS